MSAYCILGIKLNALYLLSNLTSMTILWGSFLIYADTGLEWLNNLQTLHSS